MKTKILFLIFTFSLIGIGNGQERIIDIHMHATKLSLPGCLFCPYTTDPLQGARIFSTNTTSPCAHLLKAPASDEELLQETIRYIKKNNIVHAVISGLDMNKVREWQAALPETFIIGIGNPENYGVDRVRAMILSGECKLIGELGNQYLGKTLLSPEYEPFISLAEKYDIPVITHCGPGFPGGTSMSFPEYRAALGSPLQHENLLVKHPKLRLCLAHAGWPMSDEIITMLYNYQGVYVDISWISYITPKEEFRHYLQRIIAAGFSKRILFGSDLVFWPEVIDLALNSIRTADYLTDQQKEDILYHNAVRFLKLRD